MVSTVNQINRSHCMPSPACAICTSRLQGQNALPQHAIIM